MATKAQHEYYRNRKKLTPAEQGEQAAKEEYHQNQTNFKTAFETRLEIKRALFEASRFAKDIIGIASLVINSKTGDFNNNINKIDALEIDNISDQLANRLAGVSEYVRDLKKF